MVGIFHTQRAGEHTDVVAHGITHRFIADARGGMKGQDVAVSEDRVGLHTAAIPVHQLGDTGEVHLALVDDQVAQDRVNPVVLCLEAAGSGIGDDVLIGARICHRQRGVGRCRDIAAVERTFDRDTRTAVRLSVIVPFAAVGGQLDLDGVDEHRVTDGIYSCERGGNIGFSR